MAVLPPRKKTTGTALVAVPSSTNQNVAFTASPANPVFKTIMSPSMENIMTNSKAQYEKITNEAASSGKEGVEALLKSTNIWMKGTEDIMKTYMSLAQESAAKNSEAIKTLLGCKNLNELTEAQNKLAQQSFDGFMAGATKLSELTVKLTTEALEPINDQVSKTMRKATDSVAA